MDHQTSNVDTILQERAVHYGSYTAGVKCRADMLKALQDKYKETHNGESMPDTLVITFSDILLKLMRIASDPDYLDSYTDLEGYAKLAKESVINNLESAKVSKL